MDIGIEPTVKFASPPNRLHAKRQCIADEISWRAANSKHYRSGWKRVAQSVPGSNQVLSPGQIAGIYRALRKSLETQSNEPGAADFYYGEMEMRRRDQQVSRWERAIVSTYWFVSGYGLRGLRSTILLFIAFLSGSVIMYLAGFEKLQQWPTSVVASAQSMVPGLSVSENLTTTGNACEVILRITGPVLFGLALLAIRNRIRR